MTANDMLLQFQADITGRRVVKPVVAETTALGAAYAAGLAVGVWPDLATLRAQWAVDKVWEPKLSADEARTLVHRWERAMTRCLGWANVLQHTGHWGGSVAGGSGSGAGRTTPAAGSSTGTATPAASAVAAADAEVQAAIESETAGAGTTGSRPGTYDSSRAGLRQALLLAAAAAAGAVIGVALARGRRA
jgi:hypothetical protein